VTKFIAAATEARRPPAPQIDEQIATTHDNKAVRPASRIAVRKSLITITPPSAGPDPCGIEVETGK